MKKYNNCATTGEVVSRICEASSTSGAVEHQSLVDRLKAAGVIFSQEPAKTYRLPKQTREFLQAYRKHKKESENKFLHIKFDADIEGITQDIEQRISYQSRPAVSMYR